MLSGWFFLGGDGGEQRSPVNCRHHTPVYASLWRLGLLSSLPSRQTDSTKQLRCDGSYSPAFWSHLCFTDGWIELVMFLCAPYELCFPHSVSSLSKEGQAFCVYCKTRRSLYTVSSVSALSAWLLFLSVLWEREVQFSVCCILGEPGSPLWMGASNILQGLFVVVQAGGLSGQGATWLRSQCSAGSMPRDLFCQWGRWLLCVSFVWFFRE